MIYTLCSITKMGLMENMKIRSQQPWVFKGLLMLALFVMLNEMKMVSGQKISPSQCKQETRLLTNACRPVIYGQPPSAACCQRVRVGHFECVCPLVTPKLAALIKIEQVIKVLQICGRKVPRHFKCGSLSFP